VVREQLPVALLSNATDRLRDDLAHHGLGDTFDHVFCSAEIGLVKPDPACFRHVADVMQLAPPECLFVDDQLPNVEAARQAGMHAEQFTGLAELRAALSSYGIRS